MQSALSTSPGIKRTKVKSGVGDKANHSDEPIGRDPRQKPPAAKRQGGVEGRGDRERSEEETGKSHPNEQSGRGRVRVGRG